MKKLILRFKNGGRNYNGPDDFNEDYNPNAIGPNDDTPPEAGWRYKFWDYILTPKTPTMPNNMPIPSQKELAEKNMNMLRAKSWILQNIPGVLWINDYLVPRYNPTPEESATIRERLLGTGPRGMRPNKSIYNDYIAPIFQ